MESKKEGRFSSPSAPAAAQLTQNRFWGRAQVVGLLVDTQLGLPDGELAARAAARRQGWDLLLLEADYRLLAGFLTGELPASQLVVAAPGQPLARSYDSSLLMAD